MTTKPFLYGKYVILDRIAMGGMAEVFRAKTFGVHGFQRLLVIKRILPHLSRDEEFVDMFIDEAKIAVGLTHANICQVTDLGKIDDNYFIAMEYVNGKDLRAILKKCYTAKSPLGIEQSIYIASEMCKGLDYAHKRNDHATGQMMSVIHRDISPQNIMVSYHGEVKIVDFGIAKTEFKIHRTQAGVLKGKFAYMSPEQASGHELDTRTDIFSAGILLYEMLNNKRLFLGETDFETLENIKRCEVPPIHEANAKISPALEAVIRKALAKDAKDRYQTANEMHNALSKILYTEFPHFTQDNMTKKLSSLFGDEIKKETENLKKSLDAISNEQMLQAQNVGDSERVDISHISASRDVHPKKSGLFSKLKYLLLFLLIAAIPIAIGKYFFPKEKPQKAAKTQEKTAVEEKSFTFETTPDKAKISINGEPKGTTPLTVNLAVNKRFEIVIEKEGYEPLQNGVITEPDKSHFVFELSKEKPALGIINLDSTPSGANVFINGKDTQQTTPTLLDQLPMGKSVEIKLQKEGFKATTKKISVSQQSQDLNIELMKKGPVLTINVVPPNATIFLNKKSYGKTISDLNKNETYDLRIDAKGYISEERKIKIDSDQVELDIELKKKEAQTGSLSISATPWATIVIDDKVVGTSPILDHALPVGKHDVIFRHPDFPDVKKSINIKYNEDHKLIIDLRQETEK